MIHMAGLFENIKLLYWEVNNQNLTAIKSQFIHWNVFMIILAKQDFIACHWAIIGPLFTISKMIFC